MQRLGILLSGRGSNFIAIADAIRDGRLPGAEIAVVLSNLPGAAGLEAALLKIPVGILGLSKPLDDWDFIRRGVAADVRSPEGLAAFLRRARQDPTFGMQGANAAAFYIANFGCAAEAVALLIARMAGYIDSSKTE